MVMGKNTSKVKVITNQKKSTVDERDRVRLYNYFKENKKMFRSGVNWQRKERE